MNIKEYTVGFIFDEFDNVLLIHKDRPADQVGKVNGIGGKIEKGETPLQCIIREAQEECGLKIDKWNNGGIKRAESAIIYLFYTSIKNDEIVKYKSLTSEKVELFKMNNLPDNLYDTTKELIIKFHNKLRGIK